MTLFGDINLRRAANVLALLFSISALILFSQITVPFVDFIFT